MSNRLIKVFTSGMNNLPKPKVRRYAFRFYFQRVVEVLSRLRRLSTVGQQRSQVNSGAKVGLVQGQALLEQLN